MARFGMFAFDLSQPGFRFGDVCNGEEVGDEFAVFYADFCGMGRFESVDGGRCLVGRGGLG